jgi:putative restriction endonuclease
MTDGRVFGEITGVAPGGAYSTRLELRAAGVHLPLQAGISGAENEGADSIVVSGGYKDDADFGNVIIYTGHGGRDKKGKHITDQSLTKGNLALARSQLEGLPVRVVRGADKNNSHAPATGYRYDGLLT